MRWGCGGSLQSLCSLPLRAESAPVPLLPAMPPQEPRGLMGEEGGREACKGNRGDRGEEAPCQVLVT